MSKPRLDFFCRRPAPGYAALEAAGVSRVALLGPWQAEGGTETYDPVSLGVTGKRADRLREQGHGVELLAWAPHKLDALQRWLARVAVFAERIRPDLVMVDHEPNGRSAAARQILTSDRHANVVYSSLRAAVPPRTAIGATIVAGPTMDGVQAGLDASSVVVVQCYRGAPSQDARRLEQAHRAAPAAELRAAVPVGFGEGETEAQLRAYLAGIVKADAPIASLMVWPSRARGVSKAAWSKRTAIPDWAWQVLGEFTEGRLMCGPA